MIVYWILLLITALFAYLFGSMDTMVLASNFVFHRNLLRLGENDQFHRFPFLLCGRFHGCLLCGSRRRRFLCSGRCGRFRL